VDVTPIITLLGTFTGAGQAIAPALAGLGFLVSALQFLIAHVVGSQRGQELGKGGMIGSIVGLVAVFVAPQIMGAVHAAFASS
jgi:hypothetical protein